ncbi:hypothetical protein DRE_02243 [Drechslerella stenobrocha 248]|uniref:Uncharacterized protein n=1 Tax=Drechslerella stenobrocha 248 TaxID=1043628 RepID=W7HYC6_9PEZI|nr:hypothetical protein DRE_02243 [Drechslerella stenobrocha 248]
MEDDLDSYHLSLLRAFRQHRGKFSLAEQSSAGKPQGTAVAQNIARVNPLLRNYREFFEAGLLRILSRDDLNSIDLKALPSKKSRVLVEKLGDLFSLLDEISSRTFGSAFCETTPAQDIFTEDGSYPQLERILLCLDQSDGPFELASGTSLSIFEISTIASGTAARTLVRELNHTLDSIKLTSQKLSASTEVKSGSPDATDSRIQLLDSEYREFIGLILDTIRADFAKCEPQGCDSPHQVMIRLFDIAVSHSSDSVQTDLDIYVRCPRHKNWQNTRCRLGQGTLAERTRNRKLCDLVKNSLRRKEGLLLLFEKSSAVFNRSHDPYDLPSADPNTYPIRDLKCLIGVHRVFNLPSSESEPQGLFNHPERRALAAKLALNLLTFCNWRHTSRPWANNDVYFLGSSPNEYDRKSPYVTCQVGEDSTTVFEVSEDDEPIGCFTEFAKLLLEIEYGPLPNGDFSADNDYGWTIIRDFHHSKQSWGDLSRQNYLDAVHACLQFDQLLQTARNTRSGRLETLQETYRKLIRTKILRNIVIDLPSFQQPPSAKRARYTPSFSDDDSSEQASDCNSDSENESDTDSGSDIDSFNDKRSRDLYPVHQKLQRTPEYMTKIDHIAGKTVSFSAQTEILVSKPACRLPLQATITSKRVYFGQDPHVNAGSLFDYSSSPEPPTSASPAKNWFEILNASVRPTMCRSRRTRDKPVKVAVLDTGIDATHPKILEHLEWNGSRIVDCQDWTESPDGPNDSMGHGTAVSDVLLQVAKVHLYVGKISDSAEFDNTTPAKVAKAIEHATSPSGWNVDIVVLSLGFEREDESIRRAVRDAHNRDKIILAAASNSGSIIPHKRVAYPARIQGQVLSIRSATGQNVRSHASPTPSNGDDNFMVLGEGIKAAWPTTLNNGYLTRYVSGSSFATPVAAGIAALLMEFSIQKEKSGPNIPKESAAILWTYRGIRKVFQNMSAVDDQSMNVDCRMICPWKLFDPDRGYEGCRIEINRLMQGV